MRKMELLKKTAGSLAKLSKQLKVIIPIIVVFVIVYLIWGKIALVLSAIVLTVVPVVVSEVFMSHIEKRIRKQRIGKLRYVFNTVFCISLSYLSILIIYNDFQLREVHISNDIEIVEFANSRNSYATLHAGQFFTSGIDITSTHTSGMGFFFGGGYVEIPHDTRTDTTLYNLYIIEFDDMAALFMVRDGGAVPGIGKDGLFVEKSEDHVQKYSDKTLISYFAADWDIDEEYLRSYLLPVVLQPSEATGIHRKSVITGAICVSLALISAYLSFALPKLPGFKRHSKLGKQISKREDFSIIEQKIKEQMKKPVFYNDSITITTDYIIGEGNRNEVGFWYTDQLTSMEIEEDSVFSDGDMQYKVTLHTDNEWFQFLTYDIEALEDMQSRING